MQIFLNLSPYIVNYLNSFVDTNASQVVESITRKYIDTSRRTQPTVAEPYVTERAEKQRVKPNRTPKASPAIKRTKNLRPRSDKCFKPIFINWNGNRCYSDLSLCQTHGKQYHGIQVMFLEKLGEKHWIFS